MKLSHSKLGTILNCPMTYYLRYKCGISKKEEKPALQIGSAVHWGIEHNTEDLSEFFQKNGTFVQQTTYSKEQILSEGMVHGYFKHHDEIFDKILTNENGQKLSLVDEQHELYLTGHLPSTKTEEKYQEFVGIIDLLLLTERGFIIIDYKTSTYEPDWDQYLDQIYRYKFLLQTVFPDVPVYKIGIINLRKTGIRQKKAENDIEFKNRMYFEYEVNDEELVNYHEYLSSELDENKFKEYMSNLSMMADLAYEIDKQQLFYINYAGSRNQYGKTEYYDIFYHTTDNYLNYEISDKIWNEESGKLLEKRDCIPLDMEVIEHVNDNKLLNNYDKFEKIINDLKYDDLNKKALFNELSTDYLIDNELLETYWNTYTNKYKWNKPKDEVEGSENKEEIENE